MAKVINTDSSVQNSFWLDIKTGFQKSFWVANIMELFERLAYYGQAVILSIYLRDHLHFGETDAGWLQSAFGFLIYGLPIFAGAIADKIGFKKAFSIAFFVLSIGYFMIGASGIPFFAPFFNMFGLWHSMLIVLVFTAMGGSFIKPSVLGTVALSSTPKTKSFGYAIYYWLVNIGGAVGPLIAFFTRQQLGIEKVYLISSLSCGLMFISTLVFYKNPVTKDNQPSASVLQIAKNLYEVVTNTPFMLFLLIFSIYWLMFWQIFVIVPYYLKDHISKDAPFELIESVGTWGIIALQLFINLATRKMKSIFAIILGFFISTCSWLIILSHPTIPLFIAGIVMFSVGEQTQAPRFYEYIADLAPRGKEAMYQGFAFLPIAIGWGFGGILGGKLYEQFGKSDHPSTVFLILFAVGMIGTILLALHNRYYTAKLKKSAI